MSALAAFAARNRWIWAALGVAVLWLTLALLTERFSLHSLTGVARSASFLALVALGQMFVVTTGRGNIDLSVASVVTLSAFITVTVSGGADVRLPLALAAALGAGALTGLANAFLVVLLKIPAMIATLAMGYVLATATLLINQQMRGFDVSPMLTAVAGGDVGGVPAIALVALAATALAGLTLARTAYGRALSAAGQNLTAADLAGVATGRVIAAAFVVSALASSIAGALLSAYVGGAFLDMGTPFLLQSVGAVVIGGSLIFGGSSTALGTLFGALLLVMIVSTMQIAGLPTGAQDIVQGLAIIFVLTAAGASGARDRGWRGRRRGT